LRIAHYYGAAELSFVAAASAEGDGALRPFRAVEIEVRDDPAPGTIWVRSPWLCDGCAGPPGSLLRAEGWATVRDVGTFESGVLVVRGRPDAIVTAGATVLIADVEAVLVPAARGGVAVHAVPHPTMGALVAATLTMDADRETLERLARDRLPVTHRPRVWRVVSHLPLTEGGKVDRAALAR
jgi:acyl-CoA synthetase (AMP-forming)/AMP-acid ligase II